MSDTSVVVNVQLVSGYTDVICMFSNETFKTLQFQGCYYYWYTGRHINQGNRGDTKLGLMEIWSFLNILIIYIPILFQVLPTTAKVGGSGLYEK